MRRTLFARISLVGILIQLIIGMPAAAANLKAAAAQKIQGVVKDALGRPLKQAALALRRPTARSSRTARATTWDNYIQRSRARHLRRGSNQAWIQDRKPL